MIRNFKVRWYGGMLITGWIAAFLLAAIFGKWWPGGRNLIFWGLVLFWVVGFVGVLFRDWQGANTKMFESPGKWNPNDLPREYRFITKGTTRRDLVSQLGDYEEVVGTGAGRYDLPSGGAIFVFMDWPVTDESLVTGVQFYPREGAVPLFPA